MNVYLSEYTYMHDNIQNSILFYIWNSRTLLSHSLSQTAFFGLQSAWHFALRSKQKKKYFFLSLSIYSATLEQKVMNRETYRKHGLFLVEFRSTKCIYTECYSFSSSLLWLCICYLPRNVRLRYLMMNRRLCWRTRTFHLHMHLLVKHLVFSS